MAKLQEALQAVASDLASFAAKDDYWALFTGVFGGPPGTTAAVAIQNQLRRKDLSQLARVEVINGAQLGVAHAAYASASNTIYLSDRFLAKATLPDLRAALLEEIGHAIDARVNVSDRPGDEGELFSLVVRGITPTASERQRIAAEDDRRTLTINGAQVAVELAAPVVYETTTIWPTAGGISISWSGSYGYKISGINAVWETSKGANYQLRFFNGSSTSIIATSPYKNFGGQKGNGVFGDYVISGATVAYIKTSGDGSRDVYRFSGGATSKLTAGAANPRNLLIEGNTIVWQGSGATTEKPEIYRYNGTTTSRITTNAVEEEDVQLSGNNLVWAAFDGNDYEIYLNDGTSTRALTNNSVDDYSPVLSGNRVAWFQWNNNQENLFFYNGSTSRQITTNLEIENPLIAGNNLVYQQSEASGDISLKLYNATSQNTSTLSNAILTDPYGDNNGVQTSGNLVVWSEGNNNNFPETLKLFNGSSTSVIPSQSNIFNYVLRGGNLFYTKRTPEDSVSSVGDLYLYDISSSSPKSTQITIEEKISTWDDLGKIDVAGDRILWANDSKLKLTQPSTKPILSFSSEAISVVEGFTSPQTANLSVTLSAASTTPVTVRWETFTSWNDRSASSGSDFTSSSGVLTFAAGVKSQTIAVPILDDTWSEGDEVFTVRLSDPSNAVLLPGQNIATITISETWQTTGANGATFTLPAGVENLTLIGSTSINGVGNSSNNQITGNIGNNRLSGGEGSDTLIGGLGDDNYVLDSSWYKNVMENINEGIDTVEFNPSTNPFDTLYTLPANVENLILTGSKDVSGTGNVLNNVITGNSGNNRLDGSGGTDTVSYALSPGAVIVTLTPSVSWLTEGSATGWGNDTLINFENVTGSRFNDTITGDANANVLSGGGGADRLTGSGGADTFDYRVLSDSLLGSSLDVITDFNATTGGDKLLVAKARAGFLNAGAVSALTASAISAKLTAATFAAHAAASFQLGSGFSQRSFIAINNNVAGFNQATDAVIEITGLSGTINTSHFVTS